MQVVESAADAVDAAAEALHVTLFEDGAPAGLGGPVQLFLQTFHHLHHVLGVFLTLH